MAQLTKVNKEVYEQELRKSLSNFEVRGIKSYLNEFADELGFPTADDMYLTYHSGSGDDHIQLSIQAKFDIEEGILASYFTMNSSGRLILVAYDEDDNQLYYYVD